jgi:hypothetical protein
MRLPRRYVRHPLNTETHLMSKLAGIAIIMLISLAAVFAYNRFGPGIATLGAKK